MTNLNKLQVVNGNAVAQVNPVHKSIPTVGEQHRQALTEGGKTLPAVEEALLAEARRKALKNAVNHVSGYVQNITRELNFSVDEDSGKVVVSVIDGTTGDVIRQIPSEEMLEMSRNLGEVKERLTRGLLFSGDA